MSVGIDKAAENWFTAIASRVVVGRLNHYMKTKGPKYSGEWRKSVRTTKVGKYHWRVGPNTDHDWYAEYGNHANSPDGKIHMKPSTNAYGMPITKRGDPTKKAVAFAQSVRPYTGSRFVEKTAQRFKVKY